MAFATLWMGYMTVVNWQVYRNNKGIMAKEQEKVRKNGGNSFLKKTLQRPEFPWTSSAAASSVPEQREAKKVR